jgi:hypothetical protein
MDLGRSKYQEKYKYIKILLGVLFVRYPYVSPKLFSFYYKLQNKIL